MNKIILLVGDSGCGKDFVLDVASKYDNLKVIKRYISREPRDNEEDSISAIFSTPIDEIKKMEYYYEGAEKGRWYGIKKEDLQNALSSNKTPIVICPNFEIFIQMNEDFSDNVVPFFIYRGISDSTMQDWTQSLIDRGSSTKEIEARSKVRDKYFKELYINHFDVYSSNVILNIYGLTTVEDIQIQLEGLCEKNDIDITEFKKSNAHK